MHPLCKLDELITKACLVIKRRGESVSPGELFQILMLAAQEAEMIRNELLENTFEHKSIKERKAFVQAYQAVCIDVCNKVYSMGDII